MKYFEKSNFMHKKKALPILAGLSILSKKTLTLLFSLQQNLSLLF